MERLMNKILLSLLLGIVSSSAFADEASIAKILASVHSKKFTGCDAEIKKAFQHASGVSFVETRVIFSQGSGANQKALGDEIMVLADIEDAPDQGFLGGIHYGVIRQVGKSCVVSQARLFSDFSKGCGRLAKFIYSDPYVYGNSNSSYWVGWNNGKPDRVLSPFGDNGCRVLELPTDFSHALK